MIHTDFLSAAVRLETEACVRRQREDHCIARRENAILPLDHGKSSQEFSRIWTTTPSAAGVKVTGKMAGRVVTPFDAGAGSCVVGVAGGALLPFNSRDPCPYLS